MEWMGGRTASLRKILVMWGRVPPIYALDLLCLGPRQWRLSLSLADSPQASWVDCFSESTPYATAPVEIL